MGVKKKNQADPIFFLTLIFPCGKLASNAGGPFCCFVTIYSQYKGIDGHSECN